MNEGWKTSVAVSHDTEQRVVEYLRAHSDFFARHLELLDSLHVPHPCRPAISLIERQLLLLREQNAQLRHRLQELVEVARYNDHLAERMQRLALGLIEATGLDELLQFIREILRDEFNADFTALRLAARPLEASLAVEEEFLAAEALTLFESVLLTGQPRCGRLTDAQASCLFAAAAPHVASAAVVPLRGMDWQGLLVVGSLDEHRFHPTMGTMFLSRMGALISYALQPYLGSQLDSI